MGCNFSTQSSDQMARLGDQPKALRLQGFDNRGTEDPLNPMLCFDPQPLSVKWQLKTLASLGRENCQPTSSLFYISKNGLSGLYRVVNHPDQESYQCQVDFYKRLRSLFSDQIFQYIQNFDSQSAKKQKLRFPCETFRLDQLIQYYSRSTELVPPRLVKLVFSQLARLTLLLNGGSLYYSDLCLSNIVFEGLDRQPDSGLTHTAQRFALKLRAPDHNQLSGQLQVTARQYFDYYLPEVSVEELSEKLLRASFENSAQRLRNAFYGLAVVLQKLLLAQAEDRSQNGGSSSAQRIQKYQLNNQIIMNQYGELCASDGSIQQIFQFMRGFEKGQLDLQLVQAILRKPMPEYYENPENDFQVWSDLEFCAGICHKFLRPGYFQENFPIPLACTLYSNIPSISSLKDTFDQFLSDESTSALLIWGVQGTGKSVSLFLLYLFLKGLADSKMAVRSKCSAQPPSGYKSIFLEMRGQHQTAEERAHFKTYVISLFRQVSDSECLVLILDGDGDLCEHREQICDVLGLKKQFSLQGRVKLVISSRSSELSEKCFVEIFAANGIFHETQVRYLLKACCMINYPSLSEIIGMPLARIIQKLRKKSKDICELVIDPYTLLTLIKVSALNQYQKGLYVGKKLPLFMIAKAYIERFVSDKISLFWSCDPAFIEHVKSLSSNQDPVSYLLDEIVAKIVGWMWMQDKYSPDNFAVTESDIAQIAGTYQMDFHALLSGFKSLPIVCVEEGKFTFRSSLLPVYFLAAHWHNDFAPSKFMNVRSVQSGSRQRRATKSLAINQKQISSDETQSLELLAAYVLQQPYTARSQLLYKQYVDICLQIIESSRSQAFDCIRASSNALQILHSLNFCFIGMDLSGIKAQNVSLEQDELTNCNFSGAVLDNCNLSSCSLNNCNFRGASLKNVCLENKRTTELTWHLRNIQQVLFGRDWSFLVSTEQGPDIAIWSIGSGKLPTALTGHKDRVSFVSLSPDQTSLLSSEYKSVVCLWNLKTRQIQKKLFDIHTNIVKVAISANKHYAVSVSDGRLITMWNLASGKAIRTTHQGSPYQSLTDFTRDLRYCIVESTYHSGLSKIWMVNGRVIQTFNFKDYNYLNETKLSRSQQYLFSLHDWHLINIWDFEKCTLVKQIKNSQNNIVHMAVSAEDEYLITAHDKGELKVRLLPDGEVLASTCCTSSSIVALDISADTEILAVASLNKIITLWKMDDILTMKLKQGHSDNICQLKLTPDKKRLVSVAHDQLIKVWSMETFQQISSFSKYRHSISILKLTDTSVIYATMENTVNQWDFISDENRELNAYHYLNINVILMTKQSEKILTAHSENGIYCYTLKDKSSQKFLNSMMSQVMSMAVTSNEKVLVSGGMDGTIRVWDFESQVIFRKLKLSSNYIFKVTLAQNDEYIVSAGFDSYIRIISLQTMDVVQQMFGHSNAINFVETFCNDKYLISASDDKSICVWRWKDGKKVCQFNDNQRGVTQAIVFPGEKYIASGGYDSVIKIWRLPELDSAKSSSPVPAENTVAQNSKRNSRPDSSQKHQLELSPLLSQEDSPFVEYNRQDLAATNVLQLGKRNSSLVWSIKRNRQFQCENIKLSQQTVGLDEDQIKFLCYHSNQIKAQLYQN